jgi:hypothetical protein
MGRPRPRNSGRNCHVYGKTPLARAHRFTDCVAERDADGPAVRPYPRTEWFLVSMHIQIFELFPLIRPSTNRRRHDAVLASWTILT